MQTELQLPVAQALALFVKIIRKVSKRLNDIQREAISATLPPEPTQDPMATVKAVENGVRTAGREWAPVGQALEEELADAGNEEMRVMREKQREMISSLDLSKYVRPSC